MHGHNMSKASSKTISTIALRYSTCTTLKSAVLALPARLCVAVCTWDADAGACAIFAPAKEVGAVKATALATTHAPTAAWIATMVL
jgi:hypothetical protein